MTVSGLLLAALLGLGSAPAAPAESLLSFDWSGDSTCSAAKQAFRTEALEARNGVEILGLVSPGRLWPEGEEGRITCLDGQVVTMTILVRKPEAALDAVIDGVGKHFARQYNYPCDVLQAQIPELQGIETCRVLVTDNTAAIVTSHPDETRYAVTVVGNSPEVEARMRALRP